MPTPVRIAPRIAPRRDDAPTLFRGARFWLSQTVPQRLKLKEDINKHGGIVVLLERDSDVKIVDHKRKNLPHDTYSYQYVELSIAKGKLEDLEDHRAGPSAPRPMGASNIPTKSKRSIFTLEEDRIVYDWIQHFGKTPGAPIKGVKLYQDLSELVTYNLTIPLCSWINQEQFPSHPWQSWRSRYTKNLIDKPRPGGGESLTLDEILQRAPSQASRPKILPTRVSEPTPPLRVEPKALSRVPALAQHNTNNSNSKRKRDSGPGPQSPNQSRTGIPPSKRLAVEEPAPSRSPSIQIRPPQLTARDTTTPIPGPVPVQASPSTSSISQPNAVIGITEPATPRSPRTPIPRSRSRPSSKRPEATKELPAPAPLPSRPAGDNAVANSAPAPPAPPAPPAEPAEPAEPAPTPTPAKVPPRPPGSNAFAKLAPAPAPASRPPGDNAFAKSAAPAPAPAPSRHAGENAVAKSAPAAPAAPAEPAEPAEPAPTPTPAKAPPRPPGNNAFAQLAPPPEPPAPPSRPPWNNVSAKSPAPPSRPPGDNAFAKSARFNKQIIKDRPPPKDPFKEPFDIDPAFLELPFLPSSPAPEPAEDAPEIPDIETWMDERLARGAHESHIFEALQCTSMEPTMADKVLKYLSTGKGIPRNVRGVWTPEDDQCLESQEHAKVQRALTKHGMEAYKARWDYFCGARESGFIE
ncbi:unnamed protein product [Penicillium olsonii]|uniref:DNA-binding protein RAP1 n=1 Tax=Penicillium olsonii TaxID=99116 RepID=A0A9W4N576_PENOL|nr:unnamed protein product [Penicillium olsonii]CAG8267449.1 unnamed protein product [Penicillium olsonii]